MPVLWAWRPAQEASPPCCRHHLRAMAARPQPRAGAAPARGTRGAPPRRAVAASASGLSDAPRPRAAPSALVELTGVGGRRRVELGGSGGSERRPDAHQPPAPAPAPPGGPLAALRAFFLPRGWPGSVTPDYLAYQLATIPCHITGNMSHALATSTMIQARAAQQPVCPYLPARRPAERVVHGGSRRGRRTRQDASTQHAPNQPPRRHSCRRWALTWAPLLQSPPQQPSSGSPRTAWAPRGASSWAAAWRRVRWPPGAQQRIVVPAWLQPHASFDF